MKDESHKGVETALLHVAAICREKNCYNYSSHFENK